MGPGLVGGVRKALAAHRCPFLQPRLFHRLLILLLQISVQRNVLIDRQRFPTGMSGDELQFGVSEPAMPCQVRDRLVPEGVGRCFYASLFGVEPHNLLNTAC